MAEPNSEADPLLLQRLTEARRAHARGWILTPLSGKVPILKSWQKAPTPTLAMVEAWVGAHNVGIRTGSPSALVVIDDDTPDSSAAMTLGLPQTPTVITGSGRKHYYFRAPATRIGNSVSNLAAGVDVRGEGGAIAAAGSIHPKTGNPYTWAPGLSPDETPLAELPERIVAALAKKRGASKAERYEPGSAEHTRLCAHATAVMRAHLDSVATTPEGQRNNALNRCAFVLGRFVGAGLLGRGEVESALHDAAFAAGLGETEIHATVHSGLESGIADPHDLNVLARKAKQSTEDGSAIPVRPHADERNRPIIVVEGGKLPEIVNAAEEALLNASGPRIYQREGLLVRMTRSSNVQLDSGIRRPEGALSLTQIDPAYLLEKLTLAASFQRFDARSNSYRVIDCTERIAKTYLSRKGAWRVPGLRAVVEAPTLRSDGSILQVPGYDAITQLYFDSGGFSFMLVPEHPTLDDALDALAKLLALIEKFPFVDLCDRSVALAAILTALVRRSLRSAPLFAFRAPKMGSGKSLLADVVAMLATGRTVPAMPQGKDEEEDRKRMLALLVEGDAVCCIDNIERPLTSAALCSILTQATFKDRILGRTGTATVPTCTTWLATGNGLIIAGDLSTRALVCDLDAKVERPEEREFDINLYEFVPEHRHELVAAALTIMRAYHVAGRPKLKLTVFGRFEGWSNFVRSALVWCGEADPCETRKRIERVDPVRHQLLAVLTLWFEIFGTEPQTASQLISPTYRGGQKFKQLGHALLDAVLCKADELNAVRLGNWLAKHERRIEGGLKLERAGEKQNTMLWRVVHVDP